MTDRKSRFFHRITSLKNNQRVDLARNKNILVWILKNQTKPAENMPRGTAGGGKRGSNINFNKPSEPAFLKRFKDQVGYKERVTSIDDKFPSANEAGRVTEIEDREDRDDEKPVVVVLNDGDLTAAEAENEAKSQESTAPDLETTKIMFKKPTKRSAEEKEEPLEVKKSKTKSKKQAKNLLSFDDEEEENEQI